MALSDLIARLEEDATKEMQAIVERADADVQAIRAATERAIAGASAERLEGQRIERAANRDRDLARARRNARGEELKARHALLARVFSRARALAPETGASESYRRVLPLHLEEALSYVQGLRPRVRCQAAVASVVGAVAARHDGAEIVIDETVGPGVVVEAADGSVVVDNTLAARLARIEPKLAVELLAELSDAGA
ncbi:MAG: V-type ATP synthase subunit E family protein [Acidobacteriota bacterium]